LHVDSALSLAHGVSSQGQIVGIKDQDTGCHGSAR
jgi:hypothetical protein